MTRLFIPASMALFLAACSTAPTPEPVVQPAAPSPEPVVETPAEPEPLVVELDRLRGTTPADVIAYMGEPTLLRQDDNVQTMIFETGRCVVEVVFYEPDDQSHFQAEWLNARLRDGRRTDIETCTREWLEQNMPDG